MRPKEDARRRAQCKQAAHVGCDVGNVEAAHEAEGDQEAPAKVLHRVAEPLPVQQHVVDLQGGHDGCWAPVRSMQARPSVSAGRQLTAQTANTTTRTTADGRSSCQLVAGAAGSGLSSSRAVPCMVSAWWRTCKECAACGSHEQLSPAGAA